MSAVTVQNAPTAALLAVAEVFAQIAAQDPQSLVEIAEGWSDRQDAEDNGTRDEQSFARHVFSRRLWGFVEDHRRALDEAVAK